MWEQFTKRFKRCVRPRKHATNELRNVRVKWNWEEYNLELDCYNGKQVLLCIQHPTCHWRPACEERRRTRWYIYIYEIYTDIHTYIHIHTRSAASRCIDCKFPLTSRGIWPSEYYHLSCSPCCKTLPHAYVYHSLFKYLRGHVELDCKSPEPQGFGSEDTLGILFVPTARVFPDKVCRRNWTEDSMIVPDRSVAGTVVWSFCMFRYSCVKLLYVVFL